MAFSPLSLFLCRSLSQLSRSRSSLSLGVVAPAFRRSRSLALKSLGPRVRTLDIAKVFQRSYNLSTCTLYAKHRAISSTVQRDTLRRVYIGKIRMESWKFMYNRRYAARLVEVRVYVLVEIIEMFEQLFAVSTRYDTRWDYLWHWQQPFTRCINFSPSVYFPTNVSYLVRTFLDRFQLLLFQSRQSCHVRTFTTFSRV